MKSRLASTHYLADSVYQAEATALFSQSWLFAGFLQQLQNENDFLVVSRNQREVVIQRMDGSLRAFVNVCAHRNSRIQTALQGCRPLICPYHGWKYGSRGELLGLPGREHFDAEELATVKLEPVQVGCVGPLVFINFDPHCGSLSDFLGAAAPWLAALAPGALEQTLTLEQGCNWKVAVENTLEFYHVNQVHRETFARLQAAELSPHFWGMHSMSTAQLGSDARRRAMLDKTLAQRANTAEGYEHLFVFPNLTLASTQGFTLSVQYFHPLSAGRTLFTTYTLACAPEAGASTGFNPEIAKALAQQAAAFNEQVFREDQSICEQVQAGLRDAAQHCILGAMETRVAHFQSAYLAATDPRKADSP